MKKFALKQSFYAAPTPNTMRKLGDVFLGLAIYGEIHSQTINPTVGSILVYVGLAGKFLSNFFKEDSTSDITPPSSSV